MTETITEIIPFILGSAIAPGQIIVMLLFLKTSQGGLAKAFLFFLGVTSTRLLQGILFGLIMNPGASSSADESKGLVVSMVLLILGILLLVTAYKKFKKVPDPEDEPPKWITSLNSATNVRAYTLGIQFPLISPKMWVFILGAIATIAYAQLGPTTSVFTFLLFLVLAQVLLIFALIIRVLLPKQSVTIFQSASTWLTKNNNTIMIVVSLVFGSYFFYQGVSGLLKL